MEEDMDVQTTTTPNGVDRASLPRSDDQNLLAHIEAGRRSWEKKSATG